jgi:hypothetical protein
MKTPLGRLCVIVLGVFGWMSPALAQNQTPTVSPILSGSDLPFRVSIESADFSLPSGLHSYVSATYGGKWLLLAGRTNGMHDFNDDDNNFPPRKQNTTVYVVDPARQTVSSKSLADPRSGLTQRQIDLLSVTSPQAYQVGTTLYMTGGYGVDTATGRFSTKDALTAIYVPGLMHWVEEVVANETAAQYIRQTFDPIFQVTGGYMTQGPRNVTLLIFGQNFEGFYVPSASGVYTQQVRRFRIVDDGVTLSFSPKALVDTLSTPIPPNPHYRRRDLNVVPVVTVTRGLPVSSWVALSGVFTLPGGAWTVPVSISPLGVPSMADPSLPGTFKQGMNNYVAPTLGLFSTSGNMYTVVMGGISFGYFANGVFQTDGELPFINQVTTIRIDPQGGFTQYLMDAEYPVIRSTESNPGNPLLFGAGAQFFPSTPLPMFDNGVLQLERLGTAPVVVGYIAGGIQSTVPNTAQRSDSAASPYIFKVTLIPR